MESDAHDFTDLYRKEFARLTSLACSRIPNASEAEDLVNEAFGALYERSQTVVIRSPKAYLIGTVQKLIIRAQRQGYRTKLVPLTSTESTSDDLEATAIENEKKRDIRESLERINKRYARYARLYSYGLKPREIAALERAEGRHTNAHQVSCALQQSWKALAKEFRKRGVLPIGFPILPVKLKFRLGQHASRLSQWTYSFEALLAGVAITIGSILPSNVSDTVHRHLEKGAQLNISETEQDQATFQMPPASVSDSRLRFEEETTSKQTSVISLDLHGERHDLTYSRRESNPPPITEQVSRIIEDPRALLPECGGLPFC